MTLQEFLKSASAGQRMVLAAIQRFLIVVTGVQAGKTTLGAVWLCHKIWQDYKAGIKGDYLIAAPTVGILRQSTLPKFMELMPRDWGVYKEGAKYFSLAWGSRIFVRSTDTPDFLEGMTIRAAWLDEAGMMKQMVWVNIQARLSIAMGPCIMTTTPYAMGWFYRDIIKKAETYNQEKNPMAGEVSDKNIALFNWRSIDNPAFHREEYERMKETMDPRMFERRYEGKFTQLEGLVYPDFKTCKPFAIPPEWERFGGMDFGGTNPTAVVCIAKDPANGIYYAYKEFYKPGETGLGLVAAFIQDSGLRTIQADPQSKQLIEELRNGYHVRGLEQADNSIELGIERLISLFRTGRLFIFESCTNLLEEIESYHRAMPDKDGFVKDLPVAKNNHACDALRYAFSKQHGRPTKNMDPLDQGNSHKRRNPYGLRRDQIQTDRWTSY